MSRETRRQRNAAAAAQTTAASAPQSNRPAGEACASDAAAALTAEVINRARNTGTPSQEGGALGKIDEETHDAIFGLPASSVRPPAPQPKASVRRLYFAELGPALRRDGWAVLPARGKRLLLEDWSSLDITPERVAAWAANRRDACRCKLCGGEEPIEGHAADNLSIRTGAQCLPGLFVSGLDIDLYDAEVAKVVRASARAALGHGPLRVGQAPKALLVYRTTEAVRKITSPTWVSPDGKEHRVEFLGAGQQFVAAGIHPDTGQEYRWFEGSPLDTEPAFFPSVTPEAVARWFDETLPGLIPSDWTLKKGGSTSSTPWEADPFDAVKGTHDDVDLERAKHLLDLLPEELCDDHDSWVLVGQALHHQFGGSDEALELWDEWSARSEKWVGGVCKGRWKTFSEQRDGGIVTIGTLKHLASPYLKEEAREAAKGYREQIAEAPDRATIEDKIIPVIKADLDLSPIDRDALADVVQKKLSALLNAKVTLATVRRLMRPATSVPLSPETNDADGFCGPDWARCWIWIGSDDCFMHAGTKERVSITSFDMRFARHRADLAEVGPDGSLITHRPSALMSARWNMPVVDRCMFHPLFGPRFELDGLRYANIYRPELRVEPDSAWTPAGRRLVAALERHLGLILPDERERGLFVAWLAHNWRHPGRKIRWAPVIKGAEGDGKSMFGELLQRVMGMPNVKTMSANTIQTSPFSGWVSGSCVVTLEEVKFHGHNRYDVINKLKPYVTNNVVELHAKGCDPIQVFNFTNYLMFTNHEDALPLVAGDRRYFVVTTPFKTKADLDKALQAAFDIGEAEHFNEIFGLVREHPGQAARWLADVPMPAEFNPNGEAPATVGKAAMIEAATSDAERLVVDVIEGGGAAVGGGGALELVHGVGPNVISFGELKRRVLDILPARDLSDKVLSRCLRKAGFVPAPSPNGDPRGHRIRWRGALHRVWVKDGAPSAVEDGGAAYRTELDRTVADGQAPFTEP